MSKVTEVFGIHDKSVEINKFNENGRLERNRSTLWATQTSNLSGLKYIDWQEMIRDKAQNCKN